MTNKTLPRLALIIAALLLLPRPECPAQPAQPPQKGRVLIEYWAGIPGVSLDDLLRAPNYPQKPSHRELPVTLETPQGLGADCGSRIRAWFYPPVSGNYIFAVAGGDRAELLLSAGGPPANAIVIATLPAASGFRTWDAHPAQTSAPIALQAGARYYIEARQKQGAGGGNLSIGVKAPGQPAISLMDAADCEPFDLRDDYSGHPAVLDTLAQSHPRLILSPAAILRLKGAVAATGSLPAQWHAAIKARGETMLNNPASGATAANPRPTQRLVLNLALLYLLSDDAPKKAQYKTRIYNELANAIAWGDWAPDQNLSLSECVCAFAFAYDWLYDAWTPAERAAIRAAIRDKALAPALAQYASNAWWVRDAFNHCIVDNSGVALAALAILGDDPIAAPAALDLSIGSLRDGPALATFAPDGGTPESHEYWSFPMQYLSLLFASAETAAGTSFNLDTHPGLASLGDFAIHNTGPLKKVFNFADHPGDYLPSTWGAQFLSRKYNRPAQSWLQKQVASDTARSAAAVGNIPDNIPHPLDIVWHDPRPGTPATAGLPASALFRNAGVVTLRDHWDDTNSLFAALKSGPAVANGHSQLELGSFVLDALGIRWAADLGRDDSPTYSTNPDTPNRWRYYRDRAEGNNTLVLDPSADGGQRLPASATVLRFDPRPENPSTVIDLTDAYSDKATTLRRGFRLHNGAAQIQDELATTGTTTVDLNWFMHTTAAITLSPDKKSATLASGSKRLE
ncbi:MAG: heparinase II/III family protein, partial [Opitutaceae bacterium]|nr:heparinase II/III family protein [Opitutaceae bacterium]